MRMVQTFLVRVLCSSLKKIFHKHLKKNVLTYIPNKISKNP